MRGIVIGDAHIKSRIWMRHPVVGDAVLAFRSAVDYAKSIEADVIVLAGDICDPVNTENLDHYHEALSGFQGEIIGIQGQHDWAIPSLLSVKDVRGADIHLERVEAAGFTFCGIENSPKDRLRGFLEEVPPVDFLVLHQLAKPCMEIGWDLDPAWIPPHVGCVLCGDLHKALEFDIPSGGKGWYTGSLIPTKKPEIGEVQSFLQIEDDGSISRRRMTTRSFARYVLDNRDEADRLIADASSQSIHMPPVSICGTTLLPVMFVDYNPEIPGIREALALVEGILSHQSVQIICEPKGSVQKGQQQTVDLLASRMQDLVSEVEDDPEIQELLVNLLSDCRKETIDAWRQAHHTELEATECG